MEIKCMSELLTIPWENLNSDEKFLTKHIRSQWSSLKVNVMTLTMSRLWHFQAPPGIMGSTETNPRFEAICMWSKQTQINQSTDILMLLFPISTLITPSCVLLSKYSSWCIDLGVGIHSMHPSLWPISAACLQFFLYVFVLRLQEEEDTTTW